MEPHFRKCLAHIHPDLKNIELSYNIYKDGDYKLRYDTKKLNGMNGRNQRRYSPMPCHWHKDTLTTVLPVYFFVPIGPAVERNINILSNTKN